MCCFLEFFSDSLLCKAVPLGSRIKNKDLEFKKKKLTFTSSHNNKIISVARQKII